MRYILPIVAVLVLVGGGFYFWSGSDKGLSSMAPAAGGFGGPMQAMPVETVTLSPKVVQIWKEFSGHVVAVDSAVIRPQVSGRITDIRFEDGQHVEKGDILIVIDPRPFEAVLNQARAALASAETQVILAEKEYERAVNLIETKSIAQRLVDERLNNRDAAQAAVKAARAAVQSAQINLDYAYIKAPIDGKVSRAELTEGNLVEAGPSAPILTSVVADERVYVDFEVDDQTYLRSVKGRSEEGAVPVQISVGEGIGYEGVIHSFDNRIDPATGTIRARALFENTDRVLLSGMSVSVQMGANGGHGYLMVSERAIGTDQDRKFVYVIGDDNTAAYREVGIGASVEGERIITSGLEAGERVITNGIVKIRPGMPVVPKGEMGGDAMAGGAPQEMPMEVPPSEEAMPAEPAEQGGGE